MRQGIAFHYKYGQPLTDSPRPHPHTHTPSRYAHTYTHTMKTSALSFDECTSCEVIFVISMLTCSWSKHLEKKVLFCRGIHSLIFFFFFAPSMDCGYSKVVSMKLCSEQNGEKNTNFHLKKAFLKSWKIAYTSQVWYLNTYLSCWNQCPFISASALR